MNREQKIAWLVVVTFMVGLVGFFVLGLTLGFRGAPAAFAVMGISGLGPIVFRKPKGAAVEFDERDRVILRRSALGSFAVSYAVFILACMGIWGYYHHAGGETISVNVLPLIVAAGGIAAFLVRSVILLAMYRWGSVDGEG